MTTVPTKFYKSLFDVAREINPTHGVKNSLSRIAESTARAMDCKASSLRLLSTLDQSLRVEATFGLSERYLQKGPVLVARSAMDRYVLQGHVMAIEDCYNDPRVQYPQEMRQEGIRSLLVAPLQSHGSAIGVIRVYTDEIREFESAERTFLLMIAELSAIALENARIFETLRNEIRDLRRQVGELRHPPHPSSGTGLA